jgi:hypothetical protein
MLAQAEVGQAEALTAEAQALEPAQERVQRMVRSTHQAHDLKTVGSNLVPA